MTIFNVISQNACVECSGFSRTSIRPQGMRLPGTLWSTGNLFYRVAHASGTECLAISLNFSGSIFFSSRGKIKLKPNSSGWPGPDSCSCWFDSLLSGDFFRKISKQLMLVGIQDQSKSFKRPGFQVITHDTVPISRRLSGEITIDGVRLGYHHDYKEHTVLDKSVPQQVRLCNSRILASCHHSLLEIGVTISPKPKFPPSQKSR